MSANLDSVIHFNSEEITPYILLVDSFTKSLRVSSFIEERCYTFYEYIGRSRIQVLTGYLKPGLARRDFKVTVIVIRDGNLSDVVKSLQETLNYRLNLIFFGSSETLETSSLPAIATPPPSMLSQILESYLRESYDSLLTTEEYPAPLVTPFEHSAVCYICKDHPARLQMEKEVGLACLKALATHYYCSTGIK